MKLFEIATKYQESLAHLADEDGIIDESALAVFDQTSGLMQDKCVAISAYIKNMTAEADAIDAARRAMMIRSEQLKRKADFLTSYLKEQMERCGISEIKCPYYLIKIRKNPVSVEVFDEESIPKEFKVEIIEWHIDKRKVKEAIENGRQVAGAGLKQNTRLDIK